MGHYGMASRFISMGKLHYAGSRGVGHCTEGFYWCCAYVSIGNSYHDIDRHCSFWDFLPHTWPGDSRYSSLQCRNGHPQPAAQTSLMLFCLSNVQRARRGLQCQLWIPDCIEKPGYLPVYRPSRPGVSQSCNPLQPGPGQTDTSILKRGSPKGNLVCCWFLFSSFWYMLIIVLKYTFLCENHSTQSDRLVKNAVKNILFFTLPCYSNDTVFFLSLCFVHELAFKIDFVCLQALSCFLLISLCTYYWTGWKCRWRLPLWNVKKHVW